MATLSNRNGRFTVQFRDGKHRYTLPIGRVSKSVAQSIRAHVAQIRTAAIAGHAMPEASAVWLASIGDDLYDNMVKCHLVAPRKAKEKTALGPMIDRYIKGRTDLKPRTLKNLKHVRVTLADFFGESRDVRSITRGEAADWARQLRKEMAVATVATHVKKARQIFRDAMDRNLVGANPFVGIKLGSQANTERARYIPADDVMKVIEACPDAEWRLIFALSRFGGLRIPSEIFGLKWSDVDFAANRILIHSPKTEHHEGKGQRIIPLFPELRQFLEDCYRLADEGETHVVVAHRGENIRQQAGRIIKDKAKLTPWPRLFQNLRASRETDLTAHFPLHVVCKWIGNSQLVAARHYLQVTEDHFDEASGKSAAKSAALSSVQQPPQPASNPENAVNNAEELVLTHPDRVRTYRTKLLENLNWHEKALQKALHNLNKAAPLIRRADIDSLKAAVKAAKGGAR